MLIALRKTAKLCNFIPQVMNNSFQTKKTLCSTSLNGKTWYRPNVALIHNTHGCTSCFDIGLKGTPGKAKVCCRTVKCWKDTKIFQLYLQVSEVNFSSFTACKNNSVRARHI